MKHEAELHASGMLSLDFPLPSFFECVCVLQFISSLLLKREQRLIGNESRANLHLLISNSEFGFFSTFYYDTFGLFKQLLCSEGLE